MNSISPNLNIMIKACEKASKILIRDFGELEKLQVSKKGPTDFVTNADLKAERIIIEELKKARPNYSIISEENGIHQGFGWVKGKIKKLPSTKIKMPHMGWNKIKIVNNQPLIKPEETDYYFVHSYYFDCLNKKDIVAETNYGINFASIVGKENVYGCQFHPEKSSMQGLNIIKEFINL